MVQKYDTEDVKKLAEVRVTEDTTIEEIAGIRDILANAGLIVEIKDRELFILSKARE